MQQPSDGRQADGDAERPDFGSLDDPADVVRRGHSRDQIYTTVLQLREPATVAEIADRAGPGPDATREYLRWFADMELVRQTGTNPAEYVLNRSFLFWRRANRLCEEYRESELVRRLQDVIEEIDDYREQYETETPADIIIADTAERRGESVTDIWDDIAMWETAIERRDVLNLALQMRRHGDAFGHGTGGTIPPHDDILAGR